MSGRFDQRRDRLRRLMRKQELPALLVTHTENIRYLTGFTGEDSYLLLLPRTDVLLSDPRFTTQLDEECPGLKCEIRAPGTSILDTLQGCFRTGKSSILGVEGASLTLATYEAIKSRLESVDIVSTSGLVEQLRLIKDREEVAHLREASQHRSTQLWSDPRLSTIGRYRKRGSRSARISNPSIRRNTVGLRTDCRRRTAGRLTTCPTHIMSNRRGRLRAGRLGSRFRGLPE